MPMGCSRHARRLTRTMAEPARNGASAVTKRTSPPTVEGRKLYADGKGKETEAPLDEPFEVGAFTVEPGKKGYTNDAVLVTERRPMKSGKQQVTLVVDQAPKVVGVDPFNKRIDRNSDDNLTKVELE